jgi:hypothetical protein
VLSREAARSALADVSLDAPLRLTVRRADALVRLTLVTN